MEVALYKTSFPHNNLSLVRKERSSSVKLPTYNYKLPLQHPNIYLVNQKLSFGSLSALESRAQRLIIRNSMFPDEFKNDLTWALGLDKIIRQNVIQLKNNKFNSFDKLCSSVAKNYRILKCQRDAQLTKEWLGKLSPRDRKIAKHLYYVSFYPDKVNMRKINKFFALESTTPKEGEILSSYNFDLLNKEELVYLFTSDRVKNGIDRYGTFGFGVPRPINDPDNHGTIIVKQVEKAALGNRILGRKFINYVNQYENPEVIKTLGEPKKINIKEWESKDNPISSIIRKKDLPSEENQNLLVYTRNKPSELGDFPICSTAVIFSETGGKKPILTSVVWDMQSMEKFPVVQNHMESLFSQYLKYKDMPASEFKKEKITSLAAEIQWYFHQIMPYKRGSAAMGDALARILMEASGLELGRWKVDVIPDIETFVTYKKDFIKNYSQLFEEAPYFPKQNNGQLLQTAEMKKIA